jgi:hypothetical protein
MKRAVSVTLADENLLWLKGQAAATTGGNVSEVIDRLVQKARRNGTADAAVRSVVGTIDLPSEAALEDAGAYVRALFERSRRAPLQINARAARTKKRTARG